MNFFVENWYLILLALVSGGMLVVPTLRGAAAGSLSAAEAVQLINREKAVVIDVREPEEYAAGHITNAKNIPLAKLDALLPQTVKNKALPVVLVCAKGPRAARAESAVKKLGYEKARTLAGGMQAWRSAGMPVVKA